MRTGSLAFTLSARCCWVGGCRLLERIYQHPGEPVNLTRLARQVHQRESVVKDLCEGKLINEGYLHRRRRPRKDREDRLFLSPSGIEAMQRRDQKKP